MKRPDDSPLPPQAEQPDRKEKADKDLGALVAVYRGRPLAGWGLISLLAPGLAGVLAPLGYGLWIVREAYPHYGPVAAEQWSRPWFLLASIAVLAFLLLFLYRLHQARQFAAIHENGLRWRNGLLGGRKLRWEEITGIACGEIRETFLGLPIARYPQVFIHPSVGKPHPLGKHLQRMPELIAALKANLYPRLQPGLQEMFTGGKWLFFGPIGVQARELRARRQRISWSDISQIRVHGGYLWIDLKSPAGSGAPLQFPATQIPNIELLIHMIEQGVNV